MLNTKSIVRHTSAEVPLADELLNGQVAFECWRVALVSILIGNNVVWRQNALGIDSKRIGNHGERNTGRNGER